MAINLDQFCDSFEVYVPVIDGRFRYKRKLYLVRNVEPGWYKVKITENDVDIIESILPEVIPFKFKTIKGYVYNNKLLFFNFEVGTRKLKKDVMIDLLFNQAENFSSIEAIIWEDGRVFYYRPNYNDILIYEVRRYIENNLDLKTFKGATPELKMLALFDILEKQRLEEDRKKAKDKEEKERWKQSFQGRLIYSFERVGAVLHKYSITGNRLIADWSVDGQSFNSVIEVNTFRVIEAGYCMSGDDKRHNIHSMVVLAKDYEDRDLIYKTRVFYD